MKEQCWYIWPVKVYGHKLVSVYLCMLVLKLSIYTKAIVIEFARCPLRDEERAKIECLIFLFLTRLHL